MACPSSCRASAGWCLEGVGAEVGSAGVRSVDEAVADAGTADGIAVGGGGPDVVVGNLQLAGVLGAGAGAAGEDDSFGVQPAFLAGEPDHGGAVAVGLDGAVGRLALVGHTESFLELGQRPDRVLGVATVVAPVEGDGVEDAGGGLVPDIADHRGRLARRYLVRGVPGLGDLLQVHARQ